MTREEINSETIYHIYNRGVEKRNIFIDDGDKVRFIHHLFHLNDSNLPPNITRDKKRHVQIKEDFDSILFINRKSKKTPLVNILAFVLMPNHFHLIIKQRCEGGLSKFMQKLGTGYTMFFNEKYKRSGALFQGRYKYKAVLTNEHFMYLPHYVHLNPLSLQAVGGPTSYRELLEYRWSSLPAYAGQSVFSKVSDPTLILDAFDGSNKYLQDLQFQIQNGAISQFPQLVDISID